MDNLKDCFSDCFKCILKNIGATIMGVKPAEIRNVRTYYDEYEIWSKCKESISTYREIDFIELNQKNNRKLVFFYHKKALDKQLKQPQVLKFLKDLGYPKKYRLDSYVNLLTEKIKNNKLGINEFPHEIGLFFGYPIKDVLGYMGYVDLEPSGGKEWKFYGDKRVSKLQKRKFDKARNMFSSRLNKLEKINQFQKIV